MSVWTASGACPLCRGDVSGNSVVGFLCGVCNLVYARVPSRFSRARVREEFSSETNFSTFEPLDEEVWPEDDRFVMSARASKYHVASCKYARRIKEPVFITHKDARLLRPCACVRRLEDVGS